MKITTLILKADEICLSATCYSGRFDAKLIMEKIDMRKEARGIKTDLPSDRIYIIVFLRDRSDQEKRRSCLGKHIHAR